MCCRLSFCDAFGFSAEELDIYARNCPSAHYLAFLDAVIPGWTAPEWVYEAVEPLLDIRERTEYRATIAKRIDGRDFFVSLS